MSKYTTEEFIQYVLENSELESFYCDWSQSLYFIKNTVPVYFTPDIDNKEISTNDSDFYFDVTEYIEETFILFMSEVKNYIYCIAA